MPKMPKIKNKVSSALTPNSELKTPNYFWTQMTTDKHRFHIGKRLKDKRPIWTRMNTDSHG